MFRFDQTNPFSGRHHLRQQTLTTNRGSSIREARPCSLQSSHTLANFNMPPELGNSSLSSKSLQRQAHGSCLRDQSLSSTALLVEVHSGRNLRMFGDLTFPGQYNLCKSEVVNMGTTSTSVVKTPTLVRLFGKLLLGVGAIKRGLLPRCGRPRRAAGSGKSNPDHAKTS
jgi:hypothetical protein